VRRSFILFAIIFLLCSFTPAQSGGGQHPRRADPQFGQRRNEQDDALQKLEKERAKRLNKERHDRIKRDTDKLLALATELKDYVDKSNENILSLDVIRKAEEIEKLARDVRGKMKSEQ
jgi:hypothetical protein